VVERLDVSELADVMNVEIGCTNEVCATASVTLDVVDIDVDVLEIDAIDVILAVVATTVAAGTDVEVVLITAAVVV